MRRWVVFNFEKSVDRALRTWYPTGHDLHLNPHHPLGKLAGEWGELLDDCMKRMYKPGYEFEPQDESGDIWYYLRILSYQKNRIPCSFPVLYDMRDKSIEYLISYAIENVAQSFQQLEDYSVYSTFCLDVSYSVLMRICLDYNFSLQELTDSNWEKLKPGSTRGDEWERARTRYGKGLDGKWEKVVTDYVGGKVAKE